MKTPTANEDAQKRERKYGTGGARMKTATLPLNEVGNKLPKKQMCIS
jgi:hypothetical protein